MKHLKDALISAFIVISFLMITGGYREYAVRQGEIVGFVDGLGTSTNASNPNYQVDIQPGRCTSSDGTTTISTSSSFTIDITDSGRDGLDTGSEAASTWYYVWVIYNPTTKETSGLLSTSSTSPTIPSGFTKKRRVGTVRNDSGSNFLAFQSCGRGVSKHVYLHEDFWSTLLILTGGSSGTWADIDCSSLIPPTSSHGIFTGINWGSNEVEFRPNGWMSSDTGAGLFAVQSVETVSFQMATDSSQIVEYWAATDASLDFIVHGYVDDL